MYAREAATIAGTIAPMVALDNQWLAPKKRRADTLPELQLKRLNSQGPRSSRHVDVNGAKLGDSFEMAHLDGNTMHLQNYTIVGAACTRTYKQPLFLIAATWHGLWVYTGVAPTCPAA